MAEAQSRPGMTRHPRPLSPHLQVYRPMLTMMMSIAHRITGVGALCRHAAARLVSGRRGLGPARVRDAAGFLSSWLGLLVLFGFTWALFHHLLGGIRHFIWDAGYGMDHPERE